IYQEITCITGCTVTTGTRITVTAGLTRSGINFTLSPLAAIVGTVVGADSNPIGGVTVSVFDSSGALVKAVSTSPTGHYTATGLPTGSYFAKSANSAGYGDVLYNAIACALGCSVTSGSPISTTVGLVATANFQLPDNTQPGTSVLVQ